MWETLTPDKIKEFQKWSQDNYKPFDTLYNVYHPVILAECISINIDVSCSIKDQLELYQCLSDIFEDKIREITRKGLDEE